jgi:hypothetical protein
VDSFTLEGKLCFKGAIEALKALPELFFIGPPIVLTFLRTAFLNRASLFSNIAPVVPPVLLFCYSISYRMC